MVGVDKETGAPRPMRLGHFFLAIDIESLCGLSQFKDTAGEFLAYLRNSAKDPKGPGRIWTGVIFF